MTKDNRRLVFGLNKLIYFLSFTLNLYFLLPCGLSRANQLLFLLIYTYYEGHSCLRCTPDSCI